MIDETRVVLVKPGDLLIFGNVGKGPLEGVVDYLRWIKETFGITACVFNEDVDIAALTAEQMRAALGEIDPQEAK